MIKVKSDCSPKRIRQNRFLIALQNEVDLQMQELQELSLIEVSGKQLFNSLTSVIKGNKGSI